MLLYLVDVKNVPFRRRKICVMKPAMPLQSTTLCKLPVTILIDVLGRRKMFYFVDVKFASWSSLICLYSPLLCENPRLQYWQMYGLSPVCFRICFSRSFLLRKTFRQYGQSWNGIEPRRLTLIKLSVLKASLSVSVREQIIRINFLNIFIYDSMLNFHCKIWAVTAIHVYFRRLPYIMTNY